MICVKFAGGREVSGILKGYDPLVNLVLDNTTEHLRGKMYILYLKQELTLLMFPPHLDPDDPYKLNGETRHLGLVVCRGTSVILVCPMDGMETIANPFIQHE